MKDNLTTKASNEAQSPAFLVGAVMRSISVYSNAEDQRLDYRKKYVFHHFVSKRKALIEDKQSGELIEVKYCNFKFS